jgi:hypothetical protein
MDLAALAASEPLTLLSGHAPELSLSSTAGRDVIVSPRAARLLTSVHTWELPCPVAQGELARYNRVTAKLPNVPADDLAHLDAYGCVKPGTECREGMVLVGKLTARHAMTADDLAAHQGAARSKRADPDENQAAPPGGAADERDTSLRCPAGVRGTVTAVTPSEEGFTVTVRSEWPLAVGDVLRTAEGAVAVVGAIAEPPQGDVAWPGVSGRTRIFKVAAAEEVLEARAVGPYSLVTQQPVADGPWGRPGQRVDRPTIDVLVAHGARVAVHEMLTVKSTDVEGRAALFESLVRSGRWSREPTEWGVPESARTLERELWALGFQVDFDAPAPVLRVATTESIRALASGEVRTPETVNYRTFKPQPEGLFCETIFGTTGTDRRRRVGHIALPVPVVQPWSIATLAVLLGTSDVEVWALVDAEPNADCVPGVEALRAALEAVDLDALVRAGGDQAEIALGLRRAGLRPPDLMLRAWPVLPPDLRPLVPLGGGRFATSDLNDLYRRVINRARRLQRLQELRAPAIILFNECRMLQEAITSVVHNGLRGTITGPDERPLKSLIDMIGGDQGRLVQPTQGTRADYSAAVVVVERSELSPFRALLPAEAAFELWRPWVLHALTHGGPSIDAAERLIRDRHPAARAALQHAAAERPLLVVAQARDDPRPAAIDVEVWDEHALGLASTTIEALGVAPGERVTLHVPIHPLAVRETLALRGAGVSHSPVVDDGWISRAAAANTGTIGAVLYAAAVRGEADQAASTTARLVLGRAPA